MIRKIALFVLSLFLVSVLLACGAKPDRKADAQKADAPKPTETATSEQPTQPQDPQVGNTAAASLDWPVEFTNWGVPTIKTATVVNADNRSISGDMLTKGLTALVNLRNVTKNDLEAYRNALADAAFEKDESSLPEIMEVYEKSVKGGSIKVTVSFTTDSTTIVAANSAAESAKETVDASDAQWPAEVADIPAFAKGSFKETVEMGGGMYAITYTDVSKADVDAYRTVLEKAGFVHQESEDTDGYMALIGNKAYSIGFFLSGDNLQIIVASGTM